MSKPRNTGPGRDLSDAFQDFLLGATRLLLSLGLLAMLICIGLLVFTAIRVTDASVVASTEDALKNIDVFGKILIAAVLAVSVATTYLFWGEEILGAMQLMAAAVLYFAPLYLPSIISNNGNPAVGAAFGALQTGGTVLGAVGVAVLITDILVRMRLRVKQGAKADQLKYGKGVKEEKDIQNVFLGKCWQLPFCRKFVRERCPIYHSKRTCWRERVGCMCEEEVIRNAMENKAIPKDAILAANYIPKNHRLTESQKADRCRHCVIYNEHQRHKYKALVPAILALFVLMYALFHGPLVTGTYALTEKINKVVQMGTLNAAGNYEPPQFFVEMLLAVFVVITLTYAMKLLEFLVFKLKI